MLSGMGLRPSHMELGKTVLDGEVRSLDVAGFVQRKFKLRETHR
jgi:hypothetical protein